MGGSKGRWEAGLAKLGGQLCPTRSCEIASIDPSSKPYRYDLLLIKIDMGRCLDPRLSTCRMRRQTFSHDAIHRSSCNLQLSLAWICCIPYAIHPSRVHRQQRHKSLTRFTLFECSGIQATAAGAHHQDRSIGNAITPRLPIVHLIVDSLRESNVSHLLNRTVGMENVDKPSSLRRASSLVLVNETFAVPADWHQYVLLKPPCQPYST